MPTLNEEIRLGREAEALLENPLFQSSLDRVEKALVEKMKACAIGDAKTHHELVLSLQLFGQIRRHVESVIQTGEMAKVQQESMLQRLKRKTRF